MPLNNTQTKTSTQIRNMYSDGMAYLNISFFNTNLSFKFYPFLSKDDVGRSSYDMNHPQNTTVNYEAAYALYQMSKDIIDNKVQECNMVIPCAGGASLTLERKMSQMGQLETILSINKNNTIISFKFQTFIQQVKENGQVTTKIIESGLGVFMKTINGYLEGINSDRHLDKLTDDFVKAQGGSQPQQQPFQQQQGYQKKNYNNNYPRKNYNNQNRNNNWSPPNQQNMSSYSLPN